MTDNIGVLYGQRVARELLPLTPEDISEGRPSGLQFECEVRKRPSVRFCTGPSQRTVPVPRGT